MRTIRFLLIAATLLQLSRAVNAQPAEVEGSVLDSGRTPISGARITAKAPNGSVLAFTVSSPAGTYKLTVPNRGQLSMSCEVLSTDREYDRNPRVENLTVQTSPFQKDFTFFQVRADASYWSDWARFAQQHATQTKQTAIYVDQWKQVESSNLPPDAKATAAKQLRKITDTPVDGTLDDYNLVNTDTLHRALKGDMSVYRQLPASVKADVAKARPSSSDEKYRIRDFAPDAATAATASQSDSVPHMSPSSSPAKAASKK